MRKPSLNKTLETIEEKIEDSDPVDYIKLEHNTIEPLDSDRKVDFNEDNWSEKESDTQDLALESSLKLDQLIKKLEILPDGLIVPVHSKTGSEILSPTSSSFQAIPQSFRSSISELESNAAPQENSFPSYFQSEVQKNFENINSTTDKEIQESISATIQVMNKLKDIELEELANL